MSVMVFCPLPRSHNLAVSSRLQVASCRPSGLKAMLLTLLVWPCATVDVRPLQQEVVQEGGRVGGAGGWVEAPCTAAVLTRGGGGTRGVYEGKAAITLSVAMFCPLPRSHTLAMLSLPPVATCRPSGLKAMLVTFSV